MDQTIEQRRHPRQQVDCAVMITPNGDRHNAHVFDLSTGGARMELPLDWNPPDGIALRVFFLFDSDCPIVLQGHVTRVGIDHLGLEFEPAQEDSIRQVMELIR